MTLGLTWGAYGGLSRERRPDGVPGVVFDDGIQDVSHEAILAAEKTSHYPSTTPFEYPVRLRATPSSLTLVGGERVTRNS